MEACNANYVGGDINGGSATGAAPLPPGRPLDPYTTPRSGALPLLLVHAARAAASTACAAGSQPVRHFVGPDAGRA